MDCRLRKKVLDDEKDYIQGTIELEADRIDICVTASYNPEGNGREKWMKRRTRNVFRTTLLHSGVPANLRAECLYAVRDVRNRLARVGRSSTPKDLLHGAKRNVVHI